MKPGDFYDGSPTFKPAPWLTDPNWSPPPPPSVPEMKPFEFNPELDFNPEPTETPREVKPFGTRPFPYNPDWNKPDLWGDPFTDPPQDMPNPWYHDPNNPTPPIELSPGQRSPIDFTMKGAAAAGRVGDTEVAHLTKGEVVLPAEAAQKLKGQIERVMGKGSVPSRTVGSPEASINPTTGMEEFFNPLRVIKNTIDTLTGRTQRDIDRNQREWYKREQRKLQQQYKKQQREFERKVQDQIRTQERIAAEQTRETEKQIMKERVQMIKGKRELAKTDLAAAQGMASVGGESGVTDPLSHSSRRYAPQRRKRKTITGAAAPTLMVGGSYRPQ